MNQIKTDNKKFLLYLIFVIGLTVVLLYIKFPSKALANYIRIQAEKSFSDISINFRKLGLTLSPGIKIQGLSISLKEAPEIPVYFSEKTTIRVSVLGWLKGDSKYYFESFVKGGEISGFLEEKNEVKKERVDATIDIKGVKLDENTFIHPALGERLEGVLTGKVTFMGNLSDPLKGITEISLDLSEGKVKLKKTFLDMDVLEFKKMNISGVIDNRRLSIKDLNMTGGPVNGSATGTIQISNDLLGSRLNLKAEIEPSSSMGREAPGMEKAFNLVKSKMKDDKLPIEIRGTFDRLSYNFR